MSTTVAHHACTSDKCISTRRYAIVLPMAEVLHFCEHCVTRRDHMNHLLMPLDSFDQSDLQISFERFRADKCYFCNDPFQSLTNNAPISNSKIFKFKAGKIGCTKCINFDPLWNYRKYKLYYDVSSKLLCMVDEIKLKKAKKKKNNQVLLLL